MRLRLSMLLLAGAIAAGGCLQAEKPSLMVMPNKAWMTTRNFFEVKEFQGKQRKIYDDTQYERAFTEDKDLKTVAASIGEVFTGRQFPLVSYMAQTTSRQEDNDDAEFQDEFAEDASDATAGAKERDLADIRIELDWNVEIDNSVTLMMYAVDAFSNKEVVVEKFDGIAVSRMTPLPRALQMGIDSKIDNYITKLEAHFADIQQKGRECRLSIRVNRDSDVNFESELGEDNLARIIFNWLDDNTVNHQFSERNATRNRLEYDQVRMAMRDSRGRQQNMKGFTEQLQKYLKKNYGIRTTVRSNSPGASLLVIEGSN